jgi:hypothetical protein
MYSGFYTLLRITSSRNTGKATTQRTRLNPPDPGLKITGPCGGKRSSLRNDPTTRNLIPRRRREIISRCASPFKTISAELAKRGFNALLERGDGYFYFRSGETVDWLDRTVRVPTLHSLTLEQWVEEFLKLREKNRELMKSVQPAKSNAKRTQPKRRN